MKNDLYSHPFSCKPTVNPISRWSVTIKFFLFILSHPWNSKHNWTHPHVSNTITFYIKPKPDKYLFPLFPPQSLSLLLKACLLSVDIAVRFYGERYDIIFIKLPLNFSRESKWVSLTDVFTINGHAENH